MQHMTPYSSFGLIQVSGSPKIPKCTFVAELVHPLQTSPHLLHLFRKLLEHRFAVKLQRFFVGCETSPNFALS